MPAYKRSDPTKLQKEREKIQRSQEGFHQSPADSVAEELDRKLDKKGYSGSPNKPGIVKRIVDTVKERVSQRKRRKMGYGGVPRVRGAMQSGFKRGDDTA